MIPTCLLSRVTISWLSLNSGKHVDEEPGEVLPNLVCDTKSLNYPIKTTNIFETWKKSLTFSSSES